MQDDTVNAELNGLREAVTSFKQTEEELVSLSSRFSKIKEYTFEQICYFFHQSDILTVVKSCLHYETSEQLKSFAIDCFGVVLLNLYLILNLKSQEITFESYAPSFESLSDSVRLKEDLNDFIIEQLKLIFITAIVDGYEKTIDVAEGRSVSLVTQSSENILKLVLQSYHGRFQYLEIYIDSLLGNEQLNVNHLFLSKQDLLPRTDSLRHTLNPLIDIILHSLSESNSTDHQSETHFLLRLHDRAMSNLSFLSNGHSIELMNDWILFLLAGLEENYGQQLRKQSTSIMLQLYDLADPKKLKSKPLFLTDDRLSKRRDVTSFTKVHQDASLLFGQWLREWIHTGLLRVIESSVHPVEKIQSIKLLLLIILHRGEVNELSSQVSLQLFREIVLILEDYQQLAQDYDLSSVLEEEELLVLLIELTSIIPETDQFSIHNPVNQWPLYQTIERIAIYYQRFLNSSGELKRKAESIRSTRLISRWFINCFNFITKNGEYHLFGGSSDHIARETPTAASVIKLIFGELRKRFNNQNGFYRFFSLTIVQAYKIIMRNFEDTIQFIPNSLRSDLLARFDSTDQSNTEEIDLLNAKSENDSAVEEIARTRNILTAFTSFPGCSERREELECFQRYHYFRYFPTVSSIVDGLMLFLQKKESSINTVDNSFLSEQNLFRLWKYDLMHLLDLMLSVFDDYLFCFQEISSFVFDVNGSIPVDEGKEKVAMNAMTQLCDFYLTPLTFSPAPRELFCYYFFCLREEQILTARSQLLSHIVSILEKRLFEWNKSGSNLSSSQMNLKNDDTRDSLFEILVVYLLPAFQDIVKNEKIDFDLRKNYLLSLNHLMKNLIDYSRQILELDAEQVDQWNLSRQLLAPRIPSKDHVNHSKVDSEDNSFRLQQSEIIAEALRLSFDYFHADEIFSEIIDDLVEYLVVPLEENFVYTEIASFLENSTEIQDYLLQRKAQPPLSLASMIGKNTPTRRLVPNLLGLRDVYYSVIPLYKTHIQQLSKNSSHADDAIDFLSEAPLPSKNFLLQGEKTARLRKEKLQKRLQSRLEVKQVEELIEQYYQSVYRISYEKDVDMQTFFEQHLITFHTANYINTLFFRSDKSAFSLPEEGKPGPSRSASISQERRKSRNTSLLLDLSPFIDENHQNKDVGSSQNFLYDASTALPVPLESQQRKKFEESKGDLRLLHSSASRILRKSIRNPACITSGLFSRSFSKTWSNTYSTDYYGVIKDVIGAYLPVILFAPSSSMKSLVAISAYERNEDPLDRKETVSLLKDMLYGFKDIIYHQLNGHNDLLTVLFTPTYFEPLKGRLKGRLRIINHSNFKIPFFKIHILLHSNHALFQHADADSEAPFLQLFSAENLDISNEIMGFSATFCSDSFQQVFDINYFPVNAILDKEIVLQCNFFASLDLIVRVEYPELSRNQDIYTNFQSDSLSAPSNENNETGDEEVSKRDIPAAKKQEMQRLVPAYLDSNKVFYSNWFLPRSQQKNYQKWNAVVDLSPFHVSIVYLIRNYGNNQFTSMKSWKYQQLLLLQKEQYRSDIVALYPIHRLLNDVPREAAELFLPSFGAVVVWDVTLDWFIFEQQFIRLNERFSYEFIVTMLAENHPEAPNSSTSLTIARLFSNIQELLLGNPYNGLSGQLATIGLDSIALHPEQEALGWSLQTVWGDDIAVLLQFIPSSDRDSESHGNDSEIQGVFEVRCYYSHILQAILHDLDDFVSVIGGGYFSRLVD